jgi:hypothetical protein
MSDIGFLSYEYKQAAELAERFEEALTEAKPGQALNRQRRQQLALALRALVDVLDPVRAEHPDPEQTLALPVALVRRLRRHEHDGEPYAQALARLADRLAAWDSKLVADDLSLLHDVAGEAEAEASRARRRLIRR